MDLSRLEIFPKVWLDHRRAVFLESASVLAVADLHLGYPWAQRFNGQMLPLRADDHPVDRLAELRAHYQPRTIALLGDIVHEATPVLEIEKEFNDLARNLSRDCELKLILGNHDRGLRRIARTHARVELSSALRVENFLLLHGNEAPERSGEIRRILMGHEHPAIALGDGLLSAKFPCFLVSETVLVLPAFSLWVAGTNFQSHPFMSPLARSARFQRAVAICNGKLLSVPI